MKLQATTLHLCDDFLNGSLPVIECEKPIDFKITHRHIFCNDLFILNEYDKCRARARLFLVLQLSLPTVEIVTCNSVDALTYEYI